MSSGTLYIVATPIGNLGDITKRAIDTLIKVNYIAAEDTRHSYKLLTHLGITKKQMLSLHDYNEKERSKMLLTYLQKGQSIALVSDAGTPLISDPGYHLVKMARNAGINVVPIPGSSALITALCAGGLPTDKFVFEGFLPAKNVGRKKRLKELETEQRTLVFYESPHRILKTLTEMSSVFGAKRDAVIARELTKKFETIKGGTISELIEWIENDTNQQKGEFVILVHGAKTPTINPLAIHVLEILQTELSTKQAIELTAKITGEKKNRLKSYKTHQ